MNTSSVFGSVGLANQAPFVAAKHALVGLTKTAALEYSAEGVRINTIAPGLTMTPSIQQA